MVPIVFRRLRPTRTTGFRSTGLMKEGPKTLFMFVFGELCRYLFYFGSIGFYLLIFVFTFIGLIILGFWL